MPTRYTYKQVQDIFIQHKCVLISEEYQNQLGKLEYVASCGHKNVVVLKEFINGIGQKCRNCALEIPTYEDVVNKFVDKNCMVTMSQEEFIQNYKNNNCKIKYNASCGHENSVSYKNFTTLNQGINCPKCVNKNTGLKLKELRTGDNKNNLLQELNGINYFKELIGDHFTTIKSFDGCKADIAIKSFEEIEDLWLGIQVKTTNKKTEREQYYFRLNNGEYDNCLLLCICDEDKNMWLIPYEEVKGLKTIGIAKKSKYNKYEVTKENLIEKLTNYYTLMNKFEFNILDTPTSKTQKQEQEYRNIRESKLNFIDFKNISRKNKINIGSLGDGFINPKDRLKEIAKEKAFKMLETLLAKRNESDNLITKKLPTIEEIKDKENLILGKFDQLIEFFNENMNEAEKKVLLSYFEKSLNNV